MLKKNDLLVFILMFGVFGIINTEMGIIGILPHVAQHFYVNIVEAGLLVSLFALVVAVSGPTMPLLFSGMNRKTAMLMVQGIFLVGNVVSIFSQTFTILLLARIIPAFFHPIYCAMAFSLGSASVEPEKAPKAVAKIMAGVAAGMVIGVPISNFIAGKVSLTMAMTFFAVINVVAFLATLFCVPSMPIEKRLTYGSQLRVLRKPMVLASILAVILMNGAVFGVFNYLADYLVRVTELETSSVSILLFIYGAMNIGGSMLAGELLSRDALGTVRFFIISLLGIYILLFFGGQFGLPMTVLTILWGILGGINGNVTQYWLLKAAPEAPDFANGLFLTAANLGTTFGTILGGFFISRLGTNYVVFAGLLFIVLAGVVVWWQVRELAGEKEDNELGFEKSV